MPYLPYRVRPARVMMFVGRAASLLPACKINVCICYWFRASRGWRSRHLRAGMVVSAALAVALIPESYTQVITAGHAMAGGCPHRHHGDRPHRFKTGAGHAMAGWLPAPPSCPGGRSNPRAMSSRHQRGVPTPLQVPKAGGWRTPCPGPDLWQPRVVGMADERRRQRSNLRAARGSCPRAMRSAGRRFRALRLRWLPLAWGP